MRTDGVCVVLGMLVVAACGASTREVPSELYAVPSGTGSPMIAFVDDGGLAQDAGGKRSTIASARKKKDVIEQADTTCVAHARSTSATEYSVPQTMWSAVRNEFYKGSSVSPHTDAAGTTDGMSLVTVGPCLADLGFDEDDLIRDINGIDFSASDSYRMQWESIQQTNEAVVVINRGGLSLRLTYKIQH